MLGKDQLEREQATLSRRSFGKALGALAVVPLTARSGCVSGPEPVHSFGPGLVAFPSPSYSEILFDDQPPVLGVVNKYHTASHLRFNLPPVVTAGDSL